MSSQVSPPDGENLLWETHLRYSEPKSLYWMGLLRVLSSESSERLEREATLKAEVKGVVNAKMAAMVKDFMMAAMKVEGERDLTLTRPCLD